MRAITGLTAIGTAGRAPSVNIAFEARRGLAIYAKQKHDWQPATNFRPACDRSVDAILRRGLLPVVYLRHADFLHVSHDLRSSQADRGCCRRRGLHSGTVAVYSRPIQLWLFRRVLLFFDVHRLSLAKLLFRLQLRSPNGTAVRPDIRRGVP